VEEEEDTKKPVPDPTVDSILVRALVRFGCLFTRKQGLGLPVYCAQ
jgi:hypothetical protein